MLRLHDAVRGCFPSVSGRCRSSILLKAALEPILTVPKALYPGRAVGPRNRRTLADAIFISYRRDDSEGEAGRLFSDLTRAFGNDTVFMDVAGIKPGANFRKTLEDNVSGCGVFLAIIGPTWATITNAQGIRRLDDPEDFVAMELSSALKRGIPVIPILVHEAKMPDKKDLPDSLRDFSDQQCVEVSHTRWDSDVQLLIKALKPYIAPPKLAVQPPVHATVPMQLPPPNPTAFRMPPPPSKKSKAPLILGISAAVLLVVILLAVIVNSTDQDVSKKEDPSSQSAATASDRTPVVPSGAFAQPVPPPAEGNAQQSDDLQQALAAAAGSQHPGFAGRWKYPAQGYYTNDLSRLVISILGEQTTMHAYGFCQPIECDWGTLPVTFIGSSATGSFRLTYLEPNGVFTPRIATVTVTPASGALNVTVQNHFQNAFNDNRSNGVFLPDE